MKSGRLGVVLVALSAVGLALAWARRRFILVTVKGDSMMPTYRNGQRLIVRRGSYTVGDVIMFRSPATLIHDVDWMVKRAVAISGDPVPADLVERAAAVIVPSGKVLVRSDAPHGLDSRQLGLIDNRDIVGVVCVQHK